jgi:hypothetical protein
VLFIVRLEKIFDFGWGVIGNGWDFAKVGHFFHSVPEEARREGVAGRGFGRWGVILATSGVFDVLARDRAGRLLENGGGNQLEARLGENF